MSQYRIIHIETVICFRTHVYRTPFVVLTNTTSCKYTVCDTFLAYCTLTSLSKMIGQKSDNYVHIVIGFQSEMVVQNVIKNFNVSRYLGQVH